jgi:methionine synthase / methylenetetrahydrofolate reductase(NADPH)
MTLYDALHRAPVLADGAMGSYLFWRTGRLSERNHVYEAFNLDQPELIEEVHLAYLRAGAQCLTTNTFGANFAQLQRSGEAHRLDSINRAGVQVARRALERFREMTGDENPRFVLGSVGPARADEPVHSGSAQKLFGAQLDALLDAGVDAILFETFSSLEELLTAVDLARSRSDTQLIAEMAAERGHPGSGWSVAPQQLVKLLADAGLNVIGINCCAPWDVETFLEELRGQVPPGVFLSVMPNAGGFQRIGNRFMTRVNPEFMGRFARTMARRGVRLIGGCCEVHPNHIREMYNYLHSEKAVHRSVSVEVAAREPTGDDLKRLNGPFSAKIKNGEFAVSVEMLPPRGTSPHVIARKVEFLNTLYRSGLADAVDITDGSRGIPLIPAGDFVKVVRDALGWTASGTDGLELIPHFTCRDLNMMGMQARLIGFHTQRIHNVLFVTGDPPKISPTYPRSTAVFDADSTTMIRLTHTCLNSGLDFGGQPLARTGEGKTRFTIGSGFEPEALDIGRELEKLQRKLEAGVDYVMTQPAFRNEPLAAVEPLRKHLPILVGVMILTGLDHAQRVGETPGVVIPDQVIEQLGRYVRLEDQAKAGIEIAVEQIRWVRAEGWAGAYLMSPAALAPIAEVLAS